MIASFICLLLAAAIGTLTLWRYAAIDRLAPQWAAYTLAAGAGTAFGVGATAVLYCIFSCLPFPRLELVVEIAALGWLVYAVRRAHRPAPAASTTRPAPIPVVVLLGLALALPLTVTAIGSGWEASPDGGWDAWTIWNLRAKFLAGGLPARAWAAELAGSSHPEYPLLLSSAVARSWAWGANTSPTVPEVTGCVFFLSILASAAGGIAVLRGSTSGLLAMLVLTCTPALAAEVPAQYADVPVAAFFLCSLIFVLLDRPLWAGLFAGLAALTKDEGLLFGAVILIAMAAFRRPDLRRFAIGVAPAAALAAVFRIFLAPHVTAQFGAGMAARLFDPARYWLLIDALKNNLLGLGVSWYHPILPLAVYAAVVRFRADNSQDRRFSLLVTVGLLAGYCAVLLGTPNPLKWQLDTAFGRLLVQWWPLVVTTAMVWLRPAFQSGEDFGNGRSGKASLSDKA